MWIIVRYEIFHLYGSNCIRNFEIHTEATSAAAHGMAKAITGIARGIRKGKKTIYSDCNAYPEICIEVIKV